MGCGSSTVATVPEGSTSAVTNDTKKDGPVYPMDAVENWTDATGQDSEALGKVIRVWKGCEARKKYHVLRVLGSGASCTVLEVGDRKTGKGYALKLLRKTKSVPQRGEYWKDEVDILKKLENPCHPSVLSIVDAMEEKRCYIIVTNLCTGGELFDQIVYGKFTEARASWVIRQCLQALEFCHKRQVVHRDLKPENFVFAHKGEDSPMQLIDFGCAQFGENDMKIDSVIGSSYYMAPELHDEKYDGIRDVQMWKASDMWSVGVIVFLLVTGWPPFSGSAEGILKGVYEYPKDVLVSYSAQELIKKLLVLDPTKRLTATEALQHPWVAGDDVPDIPLPESVISSLSKFHQNIRLKKAIGNAMRSKMTAKQKEDLNVIFRKFDKSGDGYLSPDEISAFMAYCGKNEKDAQELLAKIDEDKDGKISKEELANTQIMNDVTRSETKIKEAFDSLDVDKDGNLTQTEIVSLCTNMSGDQIKALMVDLDSDKDGRISFDEWMQALSKINNDEDDDDFDGTTMP